MFARLFRIEQVNASKKNLAGAVCEQEKGKKKTDPGDVKKYLNRNKSSNSRAQRDKLVILHFCRLHFTVCLFSYRSQVKPKCVKNISYTLACCGSCATFLFLTHFDVI